MAQTVHERFRHPWYSENQAGIMMSASICCVNCPTDASAYGQLIEVMDYSMSMAKRLQKGRITYAKDYDLGKIKQDKAFEKAVKQALDRDELMVYYQPIFSFIPPPKHWYACMMKNLAGYHRRISSQSRSGTV